MNSSSPNPRAGTEPPTAGSPEAIKVQIQGLSFFYGNHQVLRSVSMDVPALKVTALIGPSGCGKTTLLRCMNRMHDLYPGNRYAAPSWQQQQKRQYPQGAIVAASGLVKDSKFGVTLEDPHLEVLAMLKK